ncbi:MAG: hypothetical protein LBN33_05150 [Desulfovibrio sp.]|nr:hypothetical protein [Desulfovibrio sp.]
MKLFGLSPAFSGRYFPSLVMLCALCLTLVSCAVKDAGQQDDPAQADPNRKNLAYGVSINLPASWTVASSLAPESASKAVLDQRRKKGEGIMLLGATASSRKGAGAPAAKGAGSDPVLTIFLLNDKPYFMPREFVEKIKPHEFEALSRDILEKEKAVAKKNKSKAAPLDIAISRQNISGHLAILSNVLGTDDKGLALRAMRWDVYLPGDAGIAVHAECDPNDSAAEQEIMAIVRTIKIQ